MIQTEEKVLKFAQKVIEKFYLDYNVEEGVSAMFIEEEKLLRNHGVKDVWTVSFMYGEMDYGRDVYGFLTILDENLKPLYFNVRGGCGELSEEDLEGLWPPEEW